MPHPSGVQMAAVKVLTSSPDRYKIGTRSAAKDRTASLNRALGARERSKPGKGVYMSCNIFNTTRFITLAAAAAMLVAAANGASAHGFGLRLVGGNQSSAHGPVGPSQRGGIVAGPVGGSPFGRNPPLVTNAHAHSSSISGRSYGAIQGAVTPGGHVAGQPQNSHQTNDKFPPVSPRDQGADCGVVHCS